MKLSNSIKKLINNKNLYSDLEIKINDFNLINNRICDKIYNNLLLSDIRYLNVLLERHLNLTYEKKIIK